MKVLLLGRGGREHALAWALTRSPRLRKLWAAPGSEAMAALAERVDLDILDGAAVVRFAREKDVDLIFVGPEAPLAAGVCDAARAAGFLVFGPSQAAARLETSKAFAKNFMARHAIPTARSRACADSAQAKNAAHEFGGICAVKADGLAAGKGVIVCRTLAEAEAAADLLGSTAAGRTLIVEELLEGPELTVMLLTDGRSCAVLPPSRDHKRLLDDDKGPNTGGMGAMAPAPVDARTWRLIQDDILAPTLAGLAKDGLDYRGALYAGIMLTKDGPKLLEYNARFGDPETQAVLPLLGADLLSLAADCAAGKLQDGLIPTKPGACVAITLATPGYPSSPKTGMTLDLSGTEDLPDVLVFHAGTKKDGAGWTSTGGRVLTVVGLGRALA
ncbi:MAG: phosphoribosylamine--glycine ligase, partial [Elusimicrobiota bacterium]